MPLFSSLVEIPGNRIGTESIQFLCSLSLCLGLVHEVTSHVTILAAIPSEQPQYCPTCIQVSRVLCSLAYQEQLSLTLAPQGPVPVVGPLPQTIPCGTFHIKAATFATESSLVVTLFITGVFSISTDATTVEIYATAAPITRVFSVAFPQQGRWLAMTEVSCFGCFAISATTPLIPVLRTERFSSLTRIRGNAIHSAQDEDPDPVVVRTPWWRRLSKRANT